MSRAGGMKASRKFSISLIGLITGLLLFSASVSLLLDNTIFNSEYYKSAFERLGTYRLIAEMAGDPAKALTEKISPASKDTAFSVQTADSVINQKKTLMRSLIEDNVSDKMVRLNVNSLIDGLLRYFKGETGSLPELQLAGSVALKSVNLQVLTMYIGESRVSNILHLISLFQYTLVRIPFFLLFLFPIISLFMFKKVPEEIEFWLLSSAFFFGVLCLAAGLMTQLLPLVLIKNIFSGIDNIKSPALSELLSGHIFYLAKVLTFYTFLSGILLYAGVKTTLLLYKRYYNVKKSESIEFHEIVTKKRIIWPIIMILISRMILYNSLQSSNFEFEKRNLGQTLAQLWENNPICRVTDARNDLVYLLEVHIVDNSTKKPRANIGINIIKNDSQDNGYKSYGTLTDPTGTAIFMLDKGQYTLTLDSYNMYTGFSDTQSHSYQFELLTPGKSELNIILGESSARLPYLADASLQFIP